MSLNLSIIICLGLMVACIILTGCFLDATEKSNPIKALWYKLSASLCFLVVPIISLFTINVGYSEFWLVVFIGLFFGTVGDVLLGIRRIFPNKKDLFFIVGAIAFSLEHFSFIVYFIYCNQQIVSYALLWFVTMFSCASFVFAKNKVDGKTFIKIGAYIYIAVVILMSSTSLASLLFNFSMGQLMFAIGSLFFVASDITICVYNFGPKKDFKLMLVLHYLYVPAQMLIALSVLFVQNGLWGII